MRKQKVGLLKEELKDEEVDQLHKREKESNLLRLL